MAVEGKYLEQFPMFNDLNDAQRVNIAQLCEAECFYTGYNLFEDGEPGTKVYLLVKGKVEVLFAIGEGGLVSVDQIGKGSVIGCSALVAPYTYTSTTRSRSEIEILAVDAVGLRKLIDEDPAMGVSIQKHLIRVLLDRIMDFRLGG